MAKMFQVKLGGEWKDYMKDEDKILKRAFLAGFPHARYSLRGQKYEVDFKRMAQKNFATGKDREIRPPYKWSAPAAPICKAGPTTCIAVPAGSPGTTIRVRHPRAKGQFISVAVPASAKAGQAMLVPIPELPAASAEPAVAPGAPAAAGAAPATDASAAKKKEGWSTGAKVAVGLGAVGGVVGVGAVAVAGVILGEHIADEGWDATMAELGEGATHAGEAIGDAATDAGEAIAAGAEDAVEWVEGAADTVGDFIMDLF